jgi:nucleotide-binding universal stress UspA family protein
MSETALGPEANMFRKVLVPLDGAPFAEQALDIAAEIAKASAATIDLVLVHQPVEVMGIRGDKRANAEQWVASEKYLERVVEEMQQEQQLTTTYSVPAGTPVDLICSRARDVGADLIVMTSHCRTGLKRAWLGSVADGVVRGSGVPVLLLRPAPGDLPRGNARPILRRIVVALDGSPLSESILGAVSKLACCINARVILLRVVAPVGLGVTNPTTELAYPLVIQDVAVTQRLAEEAGRELAEVRQQLSRLGVTFVESAVVVAPDAAKAIVDFAQHREADMVAMATHGRGVSRLVVGSVADRVLRESGLPVLLRHPQGMSIEPALLTEAAIAEQLPALAVAER